MNNMNTDWTGYYKKRKSIFSSLTQKITIAFLKKQLMRLVGVDQYAVLECGGGNSCFAKELVDAFHFKQYDVIDNNELAIALAGLIPMVDHAYNIDLTKELDDETLLHQYNLVYSVGLVEHFEDLKQEEVIKNHFRLVCPGGFVLITAPTPTLKYRVIRKGMELLHVWQFWDEKPIELQTMVEKLRPYGEVICFGINKRLPLSQLVVIVKTASV